MKQIFYALLSLLLLYVVYLCAIPTLSGEVNFYNDVARDFLIFQEIDQKKIILIGGRSSTNGLFHGPLWHYMTYPGYLLGNGNPVTVAWFWVLLGVVFLATSFFLVKKIFGTLPALIFVVFVAIRMPLRINGLFQSDAGFFFMPFFFFTIYMYLKSKKVLYLALHVITLAVLIQLNIGTGIPFLMLSTPLILWFIKKNKLRKHLLSLILLPLFLINLILFDLKNGLRMTKALLSTGRASTFFVPIYEWAKNRIDNIISLQLSASDGANNLSSLITFLLIVIFTFLQIRKGGKYKLAYLLLPYLYFGYILLSIFNKGILLMHYTYLLVPLTALWLVSLLAGKYKMLFLILIGLIFFINFNYVNITIKSQETINVTRPDSWKSLSLVAKEVLKREQGKEFGYFVFAPDAFAYQARYSMIYHFKNAKAFEYKKMPTTYVIAEPPPANDPYMTYVWWRKNSVKITSEPVETKKFPNGFTIEKYILTEEEQKVLHDKTIELGIHFR